MFTKIFAKLGRRPKSASHIPLYTSSVPRLKDHQKIILGFGFAVLCIGALNISDVHAQSAGSATDTPFATAQSAPPSGGGQGQGRPPREALEACADAKEQAACSFTGPDGEIMKGTCSAPNADVPLACAPPRPPKKG